MSVEKVARALANVTAALPATEDRPGQRQMAEAITRAIDTGRHLVVQAGTGTGKTLAYLVPGIVLGKRLVVATATKALQDQLATSDLPAIAAHVPSLSWAVLKGRSNYLCRQRLDELESATSQLDLDLGTSEARGPIPARIRARLVRWAESTDSGDRAELEEEPQPWVWSAVSVGPRECPGAAKCPRGDDCFAEAARRRAASADVVIVNTHLYGLHLRTHGAVLPAHDVVVFDEAHEVEDIVSATTGLELGPGSLTNLARLTSGLIADDALTDGLHEDAAALGRCLAPLVGSRLRRGVPNDVADVLGRTRQRMLEVAGGARKIEDRGSAEITTRVARVLTAVGAAVLDIDAVLTPADGTVMWVSGTDDSPRLEQAPLDVGATLDALLWDPPTTGLELTAAPSGSDGDGDGDETHLPDTVVFTSATIPVGLAERLRVPADRVHELDVGTPFDFAEHALLYCAAHLPDPRSAAFAPATHDELERLITAAGGRTLALFTSYRAMNEAADALAERLATVDPEIEVLRQGELPKQALIDRFRAEETTVLAATMGFWAGIDVPGPSLTLVTIDKIPFPRPDEPLLQARREAAAAQGFATVDLPRAATMLAQGAGRLIRTAADRGVVAVLDPRLATAATYRWQLISALPPMRRTKDPEEALAFPRDLVAEPH
ncbi:MAG TPA: ATP-dependent DNA helicase [Microthrixaceae bacterium]|nr:ATP-dependent DNA helicase [Microthrixaceae bacterium]